MKCNEIIKTPTPHTQNVDPGRIIDSQNYRAMAEANYFMYNLLLNQNAEEDAYGIYLQQWQQYKELYLSRGNRT